MNPLALVVLAPALPTVSPSASYDLHPPAMSLRRRKLCAVSVHADLQEKRRREEVEEGRDWVDSMLAVLSDACPLPLERCGAASCWPQHFLLCAAVPLGLHASADRISCEECVWLSVCVSESVCVCVSERLCVCVHVCVWVCVGSCALKYMKLKHWVLPCYTAHTQTQNLTHMLGGIMDCSTVLVSKNTYLYTAIKIYWWNYLKV